MSKQLDFFDMIQPCVQKCVDKYGYGVVSAIMAQAAYESGWGTSEKATKGNNYFGLRFRKGMSDFYIENGIMARYNGEPITDSMWCAAKTLEEGIEMYFKFISKERYANARKEKTPKHYLNELHKAGYCSDSTYVTNIMKIVEQYKLTDYDKTKKFFSFNTTNNTHLKVPFAITCKESMNIRTSPEMKDNILVLNGCKQGGKYTIVEVSGGWGLLKSYAKDRNGWVSLNKNYVNY